MKSPNELETQIVDLLHDGPFGPVEFTAYIQEIETGYELFISHLNVHEQYRRQGRGRETVITAVELCAESSLQILRVSIDIGNTEGAETFLKDIGFSNIRTHGNQISAETSIETIV